MNYLEVLKISLFCLKTNKLRSALTILGIIIGVGALVLIVSLGKETQNLILNEIQGLGSKTIVIMPGKRPKGASEFAQIFSDSLKEKDLEQLKKKSNVPYLKYIMPVVFGGANANFGKENYRITILGVTDLILKIFNLSLQEGKFFDEKDIENRAQVIVIGQKVKEELFGLENPLNKKIKIKDRYFKVIGVLPSKGQFTFYNFDEIGILPYTTAKDYILGVNHFHRIIVQVESEKLVDLAVLDIERTLRNSHRLSNPEDDDFFVQTQTDLMERLKSVTNIFTSFLAIVAGISLIVGGIGIMNIMLVSVTERTKEIGLRKAVGAKRKDILEQFLLEALVLTILGGILGIFLGIFSSFLIGNILEKIFQVQWKTQISFGALFLGFFVSGLTGLIFGVFPAKRAAQLNAIDALRYE